MFNTLFSPIHAVIVNAIDDLVSYISFNNYTVGDIQND
jgi:ABC-type xylose transport system substrate-binding protein